MKVTDPLTDHLPQLDLMVKALESEQYGGLNQSFTELDQAFGLLYGTYLEELQYMAADDPQNEVSAKIGAKFVELRPHIGALRDDLSLQDFCAALETLKELKNQAITLYSLFGEYQAILKSTPKLSEIPYTHELLRVTQHYLRGALSLEAVHGRLEVFCQYHEALETQLSTLIPSPPEREAFERNADDLEEALQMQLQGIEDLDLALERNDKEAISESLELLTEAADVFVEIYKALQKADLEPRTISCIRCGAPNSTEARICGACAAVLPQSAAALGPNSTISLEEDGTVVGPQTSEEVLRLQKAVDGCLHGGQVQELLQSLQNYQQKLERNRRQFERLEAPPSDIPLQHTELLRKARNLFREAFQELEIGLEVLFEGASSMDPLLLEDGMERMRTGNAIFLEFQQEFQRAQGLAGT
jgi:hypothetical protein